MTSRPAQKLPPYRINLCRRNSCVYNDRDTGTHLVVFGDTRIRGDVAPKAGEPASSLRTLVGYSLLAWHALLLQWTSTLCAWPPASGKR